MRWPFRRRTEPAPVLPRGPVVPLTTVSDRYHPAVTGFGLPEVAGTRSLLARPPIVPDPSSPRGRVHGTVVARHVGPTARRGRLPSLRQLFAGQPADTPQPWAVRVIDRPPRPTPFEPSTDDSWPEPQQVPESTPFDPFGSPEPSDEDWMTSDAIADLQAVLAAARAPAPTRPTPPDPPPISQPIRRLTLAESRRRGITSTQPQSTSPADDSIAEPAPDPEPPALDDLPASDRHTVEEPTVQPDPIAPEIGPDLDPEPPTPPDRTDAPPARGRVTRLTGRPAPGWSVAATEDSAPTSGAERSGVRRGPLVSERHVSASGAGRSVAGRDPVSDRSVPGSDAGRSVAGHGSLVPDRSVSVPGAERSAAGPGSLVPGRSASTSGAGQSVVGRDPVSERPVPASGAERSVAGRDPLVLDPSESPVSDVERSVVGRDSAASESSVSDVERSVVGRDSAMSESPVPGVERSVAGRGPSASDRSASMSGAEEPVVGHDSPAPERSASMSGVAQRFAGRGPSASERSMSAAEQPVGRRAQPTAAGDHPSPPAVPKPAGPVPPSPAGDPSPFVASMPDVHGSANGRDQLVPDRPAVPTPGAEQSVAEPDSPMPHVVFGLPASHPQPPSRAEPPGSASAPDVAFDPPPRLGLGQPLPPGVTRLVAPPADLAAAVAASYGVDVSATPIHRGPAATRRAAALSAKAFTERGEVFLPDQLGPLSTPAARAGLAHELTHVAQQRILGADLPAEWTPAGQALEQHAVAVEQHVWTGQQTAPAPPPTLVGPEMSTSDSIQRQPDHDGPVLSWTAPSPPDEPPEPPDGLAEYADRLVALCGQRLVDLDDSTDLDELAGKIYHRLRDMLRGELLVDRERAGLLTDFR